MTGRALTEEAMLAGLRDIHLPAEAAGGALSDMAAAIALAGFAAMLVAGTVRWLSQRREEEPGLTDFLDEISNASPSEQRVALLHRLKGQAPDKFAALSAGLYRPGPAIDIERLKAEVRALD